MDFWNNVFDAVDTVAEVFKSEEKGPVLIKAGIAAGVGGSAGAATIAITGMTAAGMVGSGAGIGCAAGPVGVAVGALGGLAAYGIHRMLR